MDQDALGWAEIKARAVQMNKGAAPHLRKITTLLTVWEIGGKRRADGLGKDRGPLFDG